MTSDIGWQQRGFLNLVGLDHPASADGTPRAVQLAEAAVDPRTGGAVAVTTKAALDGKDGVTRIKTYYWRMLPTGEQLSEKLFDIELEPAESNALSPDGGTVRTPMLVPRAVWVLGRKVYDVADGGYYTHHEHGGQNMAQGVMHNLSRVMMAVGEINRQMRDGKLPQVAKILEECSVHEAVGEKLVINGLSAKGGFDFDASDKSGAKVSGTLTVPDAVARALMGFGVNTLDEHQRLRPDIQMQAVDTRSGTVFTTEAHVGDGENPQVSTAIAPTSLFGSRPAHAIPRLTHVAWKSESEGRSTLSELNLLGEDLAGVDHLTRMRALGTTNRILHDLRGRKYPSSMDHLVEYDLYDLVYQLEQPPPLSEGGRLSMISVGGNNMEDIAEGFGETIGGNSKVVYHEGLDKQGKVNRVGVIIDLGIHLSPKDEPNISAAPDVVEHLKHCKDILITHRHLDHTDGLFAYIQYGYLKGKTVHATPEVIRALRDKLRTFPSIHKDDLPSFSPLKDEGWVHVKDKDGKIRLSVDYARNATPHTARCTPFCVHAHYDGKWIGSYLNNGDARFGAHNHPGYKGPKVDADPLKREFFTDSNRRLLAEVPGLDPKIAGRRPTYFNVDITSILRQGWAPTEAEVEENLAHIASDWFKDKGVLLAMISTNDNRFETALRVATRSHRDLTEFGTNLEKTARTFNVLGVNDLRQEPAARNNIQRYLDQIYKERLERKIAQQKERLEAADEKEKPKIRKKIERNEARLAYFEELSAIGNPYRRYQRRKEMEAELLERFGREATLGSLEMGAMEEDDETKLGAVRVGRTSRTSREIMNDSDGRRLVLLTGTQGTHVEVDAALTALSEGRSLMDGNPQNSHTARPVDPSHNVVIISQTAIPGNDAKQAELVRKLTGRGFIVVQALHDGLHIHNIEKRQREAITQDLAKLGKAFSVEEDGSLVVNGMPIHAGGHGHQKDCEAWLDLVKADVTAAQHTSDPQAGKRLAELCAKAGLRTMDRVVPNFEGLAIKAGDTPDAVDIHSVGRTVASIIRIRTDRQQRKYYGGHMEARRLVRQEGEGGFRSDGLRATARQGGVYENAFATVDAEDSARALAVRTSSRPEPVPENRMAPPPERLDRGPLLPGEEHRHRLFGQSRRQTAAFVRA